MDKSFASTLKSFLLGVVGIIVFLIYGCAIIGVTMVSWRYGGAIMGIISLAVCAAAFPTFDWVLRSTLFTDSHRDEEEH